MTRHISNRMPPVPDHLQGTRAALFHLWWRLDTAKGTAQGSTNAVEAALSKDDAVQTPQNAHPAYPAAAQVSRADAEIAPSRLSADHFQFVS